MEQKFAAEVKMHHATRAKAERLAKMLEAEYPLLTLEPTTGVIDHPDFELELEGWVVYFEGEEIFSDDKVPEISDIIDACADMGIDPTSAEEDDDVPSSSSVVKDVYRRTYRQVSDNGQTCGDWLAERMVDDTSTADGKLDMEVLISLFLNNGVDMNAKWAMARFNQTRGWQGRFRMSGRLVLEKIVALNGFYVDPMGNRVIAPTKWLGEMEAKHAKWLAKQRKAQDAAEAE